MRLGDIAELARCPICMGKLIEYLQFRPKKWPLLKRRQFPHKGPRDFSKGQPI